MVKLQFVKSVVNCSLCCLNAILQLLIVSLEDGSFVRFFPNVVGFHRRSSLASSWIEVCGESPFRLPATLVSFRKEPSPQRARRKDVKSNKSFVLAFQRVQSSLFPFGIDPKKRAYSNSLAEK
jgi:hypothetical protein